MESLLRYLSQPLRLDWRNKLQRVLRADSLEMLICRLCDYQHDCGLEVTGFVDAKTRLRLIRDFPSLRIQLTGPFLGEKILISETQEERCIYDSLENMLHSLDSVVCDADFCPQILALRGMKRDGMHWARTHEAREFVENAYGDRTHFSAAKPNYADSMFAVMWKDCGEKRVRLFEGVVNPNAIWPTGTSHLCNGQYTYKIGRHRTRERDHYRAAVQQSAFWPEDWIYDRTEELVQYIALEGVSPVNVVRSSGESLDISENDVARAEDRIAYEDPAYVNTLQIKINIHTCAFDHASSLGCQNIKPSDYADFVNILSSCAERQRERYGFAVDIPYTLADASMIE